MYGGLNISKIAVIITIENDGKFIDDCLNSIIYQSLKEFEVYFLGNTTKCEDIIKKFASKDNRINFKSNIESDFLNFNNIDAEYILFVNSNDWLDLNAFENLYYVINPDDLDILMFDKLNFINESYFEKDSLTNFISLKNDFVPEIFNFNDIFDVLLEIPPSIYYKLYKTTLLRKINFKFKNDSFFNNNLLFFKSILAADKISILDDFVYIKRNISAPVKLPINILSDLVDYLNKVIDIFKEFDLFEDYKIPLFNYKFDVIRYWYSFIRTNFKIYNFDYIQKDFFKMYEDKILLNLLKNNLSQDNFLFFETLVKSVTMNELFLTYENNDLKRINKNLIEQSKINERNLLSYDLFMDKIDMWCSSFNIVQDELYSDLQSLEKDIRRITNENNALKKEIHSNSLTISNLNNENNALKKEIRYNSITISNLNDKNNYLNSMIQYLSNNDSNSEKKMKKNKSC